MVLTNTKDVRRAGLGVVISLPRTKGIRERYVCFVLWVQAFYCTYVFHGERKLVFNASSCNAVVSRG